MGSIWVYTDPTKAPNEGFCKTGVQTDSGVTQALWASDKGVLLACDSGTNNWCGVRVSLFND